ncbi:MAG TPA: hypothetical protein VGK73_09000 [Polyangiaceae bacterium]
MMLLDAKVACLVRENEALRAEVSDLKRQSKTDSAIIDDCHRMLDWYSGAIRSLRAKLMRERADRHAVCSNFMRIEATDAARDGLHDLAAVVSRDAARLSARARRLRAKAERVEGGGR